MKSFTILFLVIALFLNCSGQVNNNSINMDHGITQEEKEFLEKLAPTIDLKKIQEFDSLYNYNPLNDSTDYRGIAVVLIWQNNYGLAIKKINQELNVNPNNADALLLKGYALNESENPNESLEYFNKQTNTTRMKCFIIIGDLHTID
jgi:tetratricopeptide (TPR) repeat protein